MYSYNTRYFCDVPDILLNISINDEYIIHIWYYNDRK